MTPKSKHRPVCDLCNKSTKVVIKCHCGKWLCPQCTLSRHDHEHYDLIKPKDEVSLESKSKSK